jgi:putative polyhydroxyalkanoate system protein
VPNIRIHRDHTLGLAKARKIAAQWAEQVEEKFSMQCSFEEHGVHDTVHFMRSGVDGKLVVAADHFSLDAKLGLLIGAFAKTIQSEIENNLDALLAKSAAKPKKK